MRSSLSQIAGSAVLAAATLVPSIASSQEPANVHAQSYKWGLLGAGKTTVYTVTQPGCVYTPRAVLYSDGCGTRPGIGFVPTPAEIVTGRYVDTRIDWKNSVLGLPGKGLAKLGEGLSHLGEALTPLHSAHFFKGYQNCAPTIQCNPCVQVYNSDSNPRYQAPTPATDQGRESVLRQDDAKPKSVPAQPKIPVQQPDTGSPNLAPPTFEPQISPAKTAGYYARGLR